MASSPVPRDKLGLALAGGGFRAALFHVGVLRRLADLDLLRCVEVISTVSGGTFVGLLYALLLKKKLEENAALDQTQYRQLVQELEEVLRQAIQKDLRNRLFLKPLKLLRMMFSPYSLAERVSELYEEHLLQAVVTQHFPAEHKNHLLQALDEICGELLLTENYHDNVNVLFQALQDQCGADLFNRARLDLLKGRIPLVGIKTRPGGKHINEWGFSDLESYNWHQIQNGGSPITKLVVNATSLNTGARFVFTASEVGEWFYGYFRGDDAQKLKDYKRALAQPEVVADTTLMPEAYFHTISRPTLQHLLAWWNRTGHLLEEGDFDQIAWDNETPQDNWPEPWAALHTAWRAYFTPSAHAASGLGLYTFCRTEMGQLRLARETVRHLGLCHGDQSCGCGLQPEDHLHVLADILAAEWEKYLEHTGRWLNELAQDPNSRNALFTLIEQLYLIRSAHRASDNFIDDWVSLTCTQALAGSANFPPLFPPFPIEGLYDNKTVTTIGLTDGGVYDNLGVMGLINEDCNYIISSDTGGVFPFVREPALGHLSMSFRINEILYALSVRQRHLKLVDRHIVSAGLGSLTGAWGDTEQLHLLHAPRQLHGLALFRIDADLVSFQEANHQGRRPFNAKDVAQIRTDLDGFTDLEMDVLINYGYATAGLYIKNWLDLQNRPDNQNLPRHIQKRYANSGYRYCQAAQSQWVDPLQAKAPHPLTRPELAAQAMQLAGFRLFRHLRIFFRASSLRKFFLIAALAVLWLSLYPLLGDLDKPGLPLLTDIWRAPLKKLTQAELNVHPGLGSFLILLTSCIITLGLSLIFNLKFHRSAPLWLENIFIDSLYAIYGLFWGCLAWSIWAGLNLVPVYIRTGFYFLTAIVVSSLFWFIFGSWLPNKWSWYKKRSTVYYLLLTVVVLLVSGVIFWRNSPPNLTLSQTIVDGGRWLGALVLALIGFPFLGALAISLFALLLYRDGKKMQRRFHIINPAAPPASGSPPAGPEPG